MVWESRKKSEGEGNLASSKPPKKSGAEIYRTRKELSAIEKKLDKVQTQLAALDEQLSESAADSSPQGLLHLQELNKLRTQLVANEEELEETWLRLSEILD